MQNSPDTDQKLQDIARSALGDVPPQKDGGFGSAFDKLQEGDLSDAWPVIQQYVIPAAIALGILFIGYLAAKVISRMVSSPIRKRVDETLGRFVGRMVYYVIMVSILVAVLGRFGVQVTSFAAIIASAGFAIGMAFQGTLGNFAAGIMLMVFRPFKVGDVINAAGVKGKVNEIDLFTTTLDTPDNRRLIVPNTAITASTIENVTFHEDRRVEVQVGCDYSADIQRTREVLEQAAMSLQPYVLNGHGRGYQVVLGTLGDSCVNWTVRFWTRAENYWAVQEELTAAVKNSLDAAGIGIPFPQMDINLPGYANGDVDRRAA